VGSPALLTIAGAAAALILASVGTLLALRASEPPSLPGISNSKLLAGGIVLTSPPLLTFPKVSQVQAEHIASLNEGRIPVGGAVLAHFHYTANSNVDCLCWVVSLDPAGPAGFSGPPASSGRPKPLYGIDYWLVFVDAQTGQVPFSTMVGKPLA
jgi:hypothetical protein